MGHQNSSLSTWYSKSECGTTRLGSSVTNSMRGWKVDTRQILDMCMILSTVMGGYVAILRLLHVSRREKTNQRSPSG